MKYNIIINGDITRHQFHKRTDIESIILNNTEKIDDYAFLRCYFMKSIILPETLKEIGLGIFRKCYNLRTVKIPKSLNELKPETFYGCQSLEEIDIPYGI